MSKSTRPALAY